MICGVIHWLLNIFASREHTSARLTPPELRSPDCAGAPDCRRRRRSEDPVHLGHSAMPHFPHQRNGLQPAEAFFDPLPLLLTEGIARMPGGASVNGAAAFPRVVLSHVEKLGLLIRGLISSAGIIPKVASEAKLLEYLGKLGLDS